MSTTIRREEPVRQPALSRPRLVDDIPDNVDTHSSTLLRYAHLGSLPGSVTLTAYGVHELFNARDRQAVVNGAVDTTMGTLHSASSATMYYAIFTGLKGSPAFAEAAFWASGSGAAVSILDGARDIYNGYQSNNREAYAAGGLKLAAGAVMGTGAATHNIPVMIAGSLVYGAAALWQNRQQIALLAHQAWDKTTQVVLASAHEVVSLADRIANPGGQKDPP